MAEPGTVTQASGPLLVRLDTSATPMPSVRLDSYVPVVGDRVSVDRQGSQLLTLGKTVA